MFKSTNTYYITNESSNKNKTGGLSKDNNFLDENNVSSIDNNGNNAYNITD